jgi:hypothetical protein
VILKQIEQEYQGGDFQIDDDRVTVGWRKVSAGAIEETW